MCMSDTDEHIGKRRHSKDGYLTSKGIVNPQRVTVAPNWRPMSGNRKLRIDESRQLISNSCKNLAI